MLNVRRRLNNAEKTNIEINGINYFRVTATVGKDSYGKPIRKQFYGSSKREAEVKRDEYLLNINKGLSVNFDKALFSNAFSTWFEMVLSPSISLSSYSRYKVEYERRIKNSSLWTMKLNEIKSINIQGYYNDLLLENTIKTVRYTHRLLTSFFSYCLKSDLILKNPLLAVELLKEKQIKEDKCVLNRVDVNKLIIAANDNINNFIFVFAVFTGLRQGEILALTVNDIDMDNDIIKVNKSVKYLSIDGKHTAILSNTKTDSSIRETPILSTIKPLLSAHMKYLKEKHLKLGIPYTEESILFSSSTGEYRDAAAVLKSLRRLYKRLNIEPTTFHALRHTFCTILAEMGVQLKNASVLMGHSDISVTAKIYTHVDEKEKRKSIEKLSEYFY